MFMSKKPLILIVEDNETNQRLVATTLVKYGYQVMTASSAEEAFEKIDQQIPDLILMDLQLPGIDGLHLTKLLKQQASTKNIIIIALTAYAMKIDEEEALEAGCDGYISKPYDVMKLPALLGGFFK